MKEIEILVEVFSTKEEALGALNKFKFLGEKSVLDIYFFDPEKDNLRPDKNFRLRESFRLRQKGQNNYITHKKDIFDEKDTWLYSDEEETKVENFEIAKNIIDNLGFKELVKIKILKYIFSYKNYEIIFEQVDNLGLFLEVELQGEEKETDVARIKEEIMTFIKSLQLNVGDELNAGKPELMLRRFA